MLLTPMPFVPGMQVGKYTLRRQLGVGGYALVFAAHDPILDREVALKLLKPQHAASEIVMQRFLQEARSTVKVVHPGIVTVFECGKVSGPDPEEDDTAYIAMELLEGETLADRIVRCGSLPPAAAIEIGRQLAAALGAAHRAGIIHRDLKPDNVFLVEDLLAPGGERAKVFDFGIAKLGRRPAPPGIRTSSLTLLGTPRYMSPEQCRSAARIDHRSDIYALGAMLFELIAGRPPFQGETVEVIAAHLMVLPPSLVELAPGTPPELAVLIEQLLEKEPGARPASMEAVERALEEIGEAAGIEPPRRPSAMPDGLPRRPSAMPDGLPRPRLETPRSSIETATTLNAVAGVSRVSARRALVGRRRAGYAAASLVAIASAFGAYFLIRGSEDARAPASLVRAERGPAADLAEPAATPTVESTGAREKPADVRAKPAVARARPVAARARPAAPAAPSFGVLALASKPACEIYINGRATGARTPLQELKLPAGRHRITLVNNEHGIQDSFAVAIRAGATERVAKDYSGQIERARRDETINPVANGDR